jgi:BMFP domain-containing protein YqiC
VRFGKRLNCLMPGIKEITPDLEKKIKATIIPKRYNRLDLVTQGSKEEFFLDTCYTSSSGKK